MKEVVIVIPIYKCTLSHLEMCSLQQAYSVLQNHPMVVIKPESLDLSSLLKEFPTITCESFDDTFFCGISGYNKLMLSPIFYRRFSDSQYMLIYQLDAYVFSDNLSEWCAKGYDYIGAPWLEKPTYRLPVIASFMRCRHVHRTTRGKLSSQSFYNKIGNGGFSLRKIESHLKAIERHQANIDFFLKQKRSHFYNEDVFWATEVPEFFYPGVKEALRFAFDKYPAYCYRLNGKQLPFGCHGWYKRKMKHFWDPFITHV